MLIENAIIKKARLTASEYSGLSAWLELDLGSSLCQSFGPYIIYSTNVENGVQNIFAGVFIKRCLDIVDANDWSQMVGKPIRIKNDKHNGIIREIGHIVNDDWFNPVDEMNQLCKGVE